MIWTAPSEKDLATDTLEKRLWSAANQLWAGAGLKQSDYSEPILGLIFLRFAEVRFMARRAELEKTSASSRRGSKVDDPASYIEQNVLYLPAGARFAELLQLPEGTDIGKAVNEAMKAIERDNPHMAGVLPKGFQVFDSLLLSNLLKTLSTIPADLEGDAFGKIYEYFLGTFAMSEGQKGGEFSRPPASCASSSRCWSLSTGASSIPPAGPAACSCSQRGLFPPTKRTPAPNSAFTGRSASMETSASPA